MKSRKINLLAISAAASLCFSGFSAAAPLTLPTMLASLNGPGYLVSVDRLTGAGERIGSFGPISGAMTALEYDGIHDVLYGSAVTSSDVPIFYIVDPITGLATQLGVDGAPGFFATGMAHDSLRDILFAAGGDRFNRRRLYTVDRTSGVGTLIGQVEDITGSIQGLGFDRRNDVLYGLEDFFEAGRTGARVVRINPATLSITAVTDTFGSPEVGWNALTYDPATENLYATSNVRMYRINPHTGQVDAVGLTLAPDLRTYGSLTVMARVPEPSILCLMLTALGALVQRSRRH